MAEYTYLEDLHGPYKGKVRPYTKTAAENAIDSGWARRPVTEVPAEPSPPEREQTESPPEVTDTESQQEAEGEPKVEEGEEDDDEGSQAGAAASADDEDQVETEAEGEPETPAGTPLPDDVPGVKYLRAAGIETIEAAEAVQDWDEIPDIGQTREQKIVEWLKSYREPQT